VFVRVDGVGVWEVLGRGNEGTRWREEGGSYPGVVEFRLYANVFAFFFVLGAEDLQFGGFEGARGSVVLVSRGSWERCGAREGTFLHRRRLGGPC